MKKILAIIIAMIITITFCSCVKTDTNIENYADDVKKYEAGSFMPDLDEINNYKQINYFFRKDETLFVDYSMQLIVKYDEEDFSKEKERLKNAYVYLEEPQKAERNDAFYTIPLEKVSVGGFEIKVVKLEDTIYPKNFGMIGVSNEKCEIAYLWIYAIDLDYICKENEDKNKEMKEFIEYYFSLE